MKKRTVLPLKELHWPQVVRIYQAGLDTDMASFETQTPSWNQWHVSHHIFARLVCTAHEVIMD
ncbi:hypothetical protein [Sediminicola luteus]|uniref:GNAT family N-acetyltransferase n=1 Tax=Sediminicola luteus TaxID=319238 RepID=A0A2A4GEA6_9FLAO|nr:hypothetical protein [Sediminicola luteus]PCE66135.1 hypothetical protein B7P33_02215 [Sediminicola luteus]